MSEKYLVLERSIENDLRAIERLYAEIEVSSFPDSGDQNALIVLAYRLHNLFNAFENIFEGIAAAFENSIEDTSRWHSQLLQRMKLDVSPLRPAVIDANAFDALDELRRFRHLFRYSYDMQLDPDRLRLVWTKAIQLRKVYRPQLEGFIEFLRELQRR